MFDSILDWGSNGVVGLCPPLFSCRQLTRANRFHSLPTFKAELIEHVQCVPPRVVNVQSQIKCVCVCASSTLKRCMLVSVSVYVSVRGKVDVCNHMRHRPRFSTGTGTQAKVVSM